jgi:hypothetical protein
MGNSLILPGKGVFLAGKGVLGRTPARVSLAATD